MKSKFPLGLAVLAIVNCLAICHLNAQSPPSTDPTLPQPALPISPSATATPLPMPVPQPAPIVPRPTIPPIAPFMRGTPNPQIFSYAKPAVQVWRSGATLPQTVIRHGDYLEEVFISGPEPVVLHLQFHSSMSGKGIAVMPGEGVKAEPADGIVKIGNSGELVLQVTLDATQRSGQIVFYSSGVKTEVRLARAPLSAVTARENANAGVAQ